MLWVLLVDLSAANMPEQMPTFPTTHVRTLYLQKKHKNYEFKIRVYHSYFFNMNISVTISIIYLRFSVCTVLERTVF